MHSLSKIFVYRKKSKVMDTQPPTPRLVRRNAAKNFEYTPTPSTSSTPRTRSLDLPHGAARSSFRVEDVGQLDMVYERLGLSGPEDFEIPKEAWEVMKNRSSSDVVQETKKGQFVFDEPEECKKQETREFAVSTSYRPGKKVQMNIVNITGSGVNEHKLLERVVPDLGDSGVGKSGGIKGDRPPLLTPPAMSDECSKKVQMNVVNVAGSGLNEHKLLEHAVPDLGNSGVGKSGGIKGDRPPLLTPPAMSRPIVDDGCSTWDIVKASAPDGDKNYPFSHPCLFAEEVGDREIASSEGLNEARIGGTIILSGLSSFAATNDDDSSSTTTEPLSISPNGPNIGTRVTITQWEKGPPLGSGSFGAVFEGHSSEGLFFAVKEVSLVEGARGMQSIYQLEQEIELLSQFEHENIVQYLGTDKSDSKLYIFLELMSKGSLASLYQKYTLRDSHVSNYTRQILLGLKYLHDKNVVHRDIKCANILVASTGTVKLADFGLAKATKLNDLKSCKGTPFWMAPEVLQNKGYGLSADIWSLGCSILEMLTRNVPYHPLESHQALFRIGMGQLPPIPDVLSNDARDFIHKCLKANPSERPTAAELLEHPFVQRTLHNPPGSESPVILGRSF